MQSEQEFCLRWNDHKSTLITIFESLLESNTLVDCTLAAEGQCLKAHKVVLSACSPYFQFLLTQHTDKHPIVILKDVKFEELRAMIDYMYRGEVNIPEDQLGPLLKAAESLQIRGLGGASVRDSRGSVDKPTPVTHSNREKRLHSPSRETGSPSTKGTNGALRNVQNVARKGSLSPVPRKRSCPNRASNVDDTKSNECQQNQGSSLADITSVPSVSSSSNQTSVSSRSAVWSEKDSDRLPSNEKDVPPLAPLSSFGRALGESTGNTNWCELGLKTSPLPEENVSGGLMPETQNDDPISEMLLVPKTEYVEIDDESLTNAMLDEVQDMETSGPPPIDGGPGTSGFVPWLRNIEGISDGIATPEAMGTYRASHASISVRKGNTCCSVAGCTTSYRNTEKSVKFYRFPARQHDQPLRKLWIESINHSVGFKKPWQPTKYSRICSKHFIGNRKSFDPRSPSYVPTIFPPK